MRRSITEWHDWVRRDQPKTKIKSFRSQEWSSGHGAPVAVEPHKSRSLIKSDCLYKWQQSYSFLRPRRTPLANPLPHKPIISAPVRRQCSASVGIENALPVHSSYPAMASGEATECHRFQVRSLQSIVFKCARHVSPLLEHQWSVMNRMEYSRSICLLHDAKMLRRLLSTRPLAPPTQGGCSREKSSPRRWHAASNAWVGAMEGLGHSKMETSDLSNHNRVIGDKIMFPNCSWRAMSFSKIDIQLTAQASQWKMSAKRENRWKSWYGCLGKKMLLNGFFILVSSFIWRSPSAHRVHRGLHHFWDSAKGPVRLLTHHPLLLQKLAGLRPLGSDSRIPGQMWMVFLVEPFKCAFTRGRSLEILARDTRKPHLNDMSCQGPQHVIPKLPKTLDLGDFLLLAFIEAIWSSHAEVYRRVFIHIHIYIYVCACWHESKN